LHAARGTPSSLRHAASSSAARACGDRCATRRSRGTALRHRGYLRDGAGWRCRITTPYYHSSTQDQNTTRGDERGEMMRMHDGDFRGAGTETCESHERGGSPSPRRSVTRAPALSATLVPRVHDDRHRSAGRDRRRNFNHHRNGRVGPSRWNAGERLRSPSRRRTGAREDDTDLPDHAGENRCSKRDLHWLSLGPWRASELDALASVSNTAGRWCAPRGERAVTARSRAC
jgi:hypothetical protein